MSPVEALSLSERQACCIARALVRDPRVLILDESTSALDVATRDRLFGVVRRLCAEGAGVIFISHRMDEIEELADRVTVLRSGESVVTLERGQAGTEELVRHMTGSTHLTTGVEKLPRAARVRGEVLCASRGRASAARRRRRSTSSCGPASWSVWPGWRDTDRTRSCTPCAERA